jgi:membrane protein DedA with SNARE-associated domain
MLNWLHSLLPHFPHYGYVIVFIVIFVNNLGVPLPGETIFLGAGFVLGHTAGSLWEPMVAGTMASFLGGIGAFWMGRRLGHDRLTKIRWLHLTPARIKKTQRFFTDHGAKTVFIARFIAVLPPAAANLLAGMSKMQWRIFLPYNLAGSAASTVAYILIGYFFGKQWKHFEAWLGSTTLYLIVAGIVVLLVAGAVFRKSLAESWAALRHKRKSRKSKART